MLYIALLVPRSLPGIRSFESFLFIIALHAKLVRGFDGDPEHFQLPVFSFEELPNEKMQSLPIHAWKSRSSENAITSVRSGFRDGALLP